MRPTVNLVFWVKVGAVETEGQHVPDSPPNPPRRIHQAWRKHMVLCTAQGVLRRSWFLTHQSRGRTAREHICLHVRMVSACVWTYHLIVKEKPKYNWIKVSPSVICNGGWNLPSFLRQDTVMQLRLALNPWCFCLTFLNARINRYAYHAQIITCIFILKRNTAITFFSGMSLVSGDMSCLYIVNDQHIINHSFFF